MRSAIANSIKSTYKTDSGIEVEFCFLETDPIFAGHFPGMPVVPAVYQMRLCRGVIEQDGNHAFAGVLKSRFSKMCFPGICYVLKISLLRNKNKTEAACSIYNFAEKTLCSKITLDYSIKPAETKNHDCL
jgi:3-hydroxymyristoyl/3-hydroxydecanoyl-(acyl carrier protein) dehydratase